MDLFIQSLLSYFPPLEQHICLHFLPTLTGKSVLSDLERQLLALPSCLGGLGVITACNPCVSSAVQFDSVKKVTSPLVTLLLEQTAEFTVFDLDRQHGLRQEIHLRNHSRFGELTSALHSQLSSDLQQAREFACSKGASSWLTVLLIDEHGPSLHKSDFLNAVCLQYGSTSSPY